MTAFIARVGQRLPQAIVAFGDRRASVGNKGFPAAVQVANIVDPPTLWGRVSWSGRGTLRFGKIPGPRVPRPKPGHRNHQKNSRLPRRDLY